MFKQGFLLILDRTIEHYIVTGLLHNCSLAPITFTPLAWPEILVCSDWFQGIMRAHQISLVQRFDDIGHTIWTKNTFL